MIYCHWKLGVWMREGAATEITQVGGMEFGHVGGRRSVEIRLGGPHWSPLLLSSAPLPGDPSCWEDEVLPLLPRQKKGEGRSSPTAIPAWGGELESGGVSR